MCCTMNIQKIASIANMSLIPTRVYLLQSLMFNRQSFKDVMTRKPLKHPHQPIDLRLRHQQIIDGIHFAKRSIQKLDLNIPIIQ